MRTWFVLIALLAIAPGCSHYAVHHGGQTSQPKGEVRLFLPPFFNATEDDHAGRAITELTVSALLERGVPIVQKEASLVKSREDKASGAEGLYVEAARAVQATHLLLGTVHEYRYKTDLDGDPAVGVTLRLVDATTGVTLWQGSSARVGIFFASLTTTSQRAVRDLVRQVPIAVRKSH